MIQLVVVYCLLANASVCKEYRPQPETEMSLMGCMVSGPQIGAEHQREMPNWTMRRWRCEVGHPSERGA